MQLCRDIKQRHGRGGGEGENVEDKAKGKVMDGVASNFGAQRMVIPKVVVDMESLMEMPEAYSNIDMLMYHMYIFNCMSSQKRI